MKKKYLLLLFLLVIPLVNASEAFTTQVNVTITNTSVIVIGEENSKLTVDKNSLVTNSLNVILYRDTEFKGTLNNLTSAYQILSTSYNNLKDECNGSNEDYYSDYTKCYFDLLGINESLNECNINEAKYFNESSKCLDDVVDYRTQSDNYRTQATTCSTKLGECEQERDSSSGYWVWSGLLGLIIGAGGFYFYNKKNQPTSDKTPISDTEEMEM